MTLLFHGKSHYFHGHSLHSYVESPVDPRPPIPASRQHGRADGCGLQAPVVQEGIQAKGGHGGPQPAAPRRRQRRLEILGEIPSDFWMIEW